MNSKATSSGETRRSGLAFAPVMFGLSMLLLTALVCTALATRAGSLDLKTGFEVVTLNWLARASLIILGLSVLSLLISIFMAPKKYGPWALGACLVSGLIVAGYYAYDKARHTFPPVVDVATNWDLPVTLSDKLVSVRGRSAPQAIDLPRVPRADSLEWGGKTIPEINALTCPAAQTIKRTTLDEAKAVKLLQDNDFAVFGRAPWRVEGTYQDKLYGFTYDVVIRIDPRGVDVRSISRQTYPDLGANCRIVSRLVKAIRAQ